MSAVRVTQTWQPQKYLKFQQQCLRPALDLLSRVSSLPPLDEEAVEIIDLGAGTGNMAPAFMKRWPKARVTFVDSAASMLEVAQREHKDNKSLDTQQFTYVQGDIGTYNPRRPVDLIFSNAALQWARADKHKDIMSRLYSFLKPGGVLAFQIPDTRLQPNYHLMLKAALSSVLVSEWLEYVRSLVSTIQSSTTSYLSLLTALLSSTCGSQCAHILEGDNPVADFTSSTGLRPFMKALGEPSTEATQFEQKYRELIAAAYPKQSDGSTIFNFKRFFVTATKKAQ